MKVTVKFPSPSNSTWSVKGKDIPDLFDKLNAHGWWGRYRMNPATPKYTEKAEKGSKTKKVVAITISAKPVIIMPKWTNLGKATKEEKKSWDTMWKALKSHEEEHQKIALAAAKEWKSTIEGGDDIEKKAAQKAWSTFLTDTQKKQDTFDARTGHGKKTGVILNVP